MKIKFICLIAGLFFMCFVYAQKAKMFTVSWPDGSLRCTVQSGAQISWSVTSQDQVILTPSALALHLQTGEVLGNNAAIILIYRFFPQAIMKRKFLKMASMLIAILPIIKRRQSR